MKAERMLSVVVTLILVCATFSLMASPPPPPQNGSSGPIDSGVLTLLIGVASYGYKKLKDGYKNLEAENEFTDSENE